MNPTIITIVIAAAGLILSVFAANWLSQRGLRDLIEQQSKTFDAKLDTIRAEMRGELRAIHARLDGIDNRLERLEQRVNRIEDQLRLLFTPALPKSGD